MRIVEQKNSLSEEDLEWLRGTETIQEMLRQRLVVEFDTDPDIDKIDFTGTRGFYLIRNMEHKIYQFWFENHMDYQEFRANILAYKMSSTGINDDK